MGTLRFPKDNTFSTSMIPHWCDNRKFALDGVGNVAGPRAHLWDLLWGSFLQVANVHMQRDLGVAPNVYLRAGNRSGTCHSHLASWSANRGTCGASSGVFLQVVNVHMLGKDGFAPNV